MCADTTLHILFRWMRVPSSLPTTVHPHPHPHPHLHTQTNRRDTRSWSPCCCTRARPSSSRRASSGACFLFVCLIVFCVFFNGGWGCGLGLVLGFLGGLARRLSPPLPLSRSLACSCGMEAGPIPPLPHTLIPPPSSYPPPKNTKKTPTPPPARRPSGSRAARCPSPRGPAPLRWRPRRRSGTSSR